MGEKLSGSREVFHLEASAGSVMLPAVRDEVVKTLREGDDLLVYLADGRILLVPDFFVSEQATALVEGEGGNLLALNVSADGALVGVRPVSLARLVEMFGAETETRFADGFDAETILGAADDPARDGNLIVETVGGISALAVGYLLYSQGSEEDSAPGDRFGPVFRSGPGSTAADDEQEKIRQALEEAVPPGRRALTIGEVEWSAAGDSHRLNFGIDLDDDGAVDIRTALSFDAAFSLTDAEFDDNLNGTSDRIVRYGVGDRGQRTSSHFDDDGDGNFDRAEVYGTNSSGELVTLYDDSFSGVFQITREEASTDHGDGTVTVQVDTNRDDNPDLVETHIFDSDNRLSEVLVDDLSDGILDGEADLRKTYHYGDLGILERVEVDEGADNSIERVELYLKGFGVADRSETYTRDSTGRLETVEYDDDNDGTGDWSGTFIYEASASSARTVDPAPQNTAVEIGAASLAIDADNDGIVDRTESYTYSADGRLESVTYDDDASGDGTNERIEMYEYGSASEEHPMRKYTDLFGDGTVERVEEYSYSRASGSLPSRIRIDSDYDGTAFQADRAETIRYNSQGDATRVEYDDDLDGRAERITEYRYGLDRRIAEARLDSNADGDWDAIEFHSWNSKGKRSGRAYDATADGTIDRSEIYLYNDKGLLTEIHLDSDANGNVDSSVATSYNARNQIESIQRDYDADGVADQSDRYGYDQSGQLASIVLQYDFDEDGGASYERTETLAYQGGILTERNVVYDGDEDGTADTTDRSVYGMDGVLSERTTVHDDDDDGTSNREEHSVWTNGRLSSTRFVWDDHEDGTPNREETRTYNQQGQIVASEQLFDQSGDGVWDRMIRVRYSNGRQTEFHIDENFNGTVENFNVERISVYEYNGEGVLARVKYDEDADGAGTGDFESIVFYRELDSNGRPVVIDYDDGGDGIYNRREERTFHGTEGWHQSSTFLYQDDTDAGFERWQRFTYNRFGQTLRAEFDGVYDGNGTVDGTDTAAPDNTVDRIEETSFVGSVPEQTTVFVFDSQGTVASLEIHRYNAQGQVRRIEHYDDGTASGTDDYDRVSELAYDAVSGEHVSTTTINPSPTGSSPDRVMINYATDGSYVLTNLWDDGEGTAAGDGTMDRAEHYHHAMNGNLLYILNDANNDGTNESREEYTFGAGNLIVRTVETEFESDGTAVSRTIASEYDIASGTSQLTRDIVTDYFDGGTNAGSIATTSYDAMGRPFQVLSDNDGDGTAETVTTSTYTGTSEVARTDLISYDVNEDATVDYGRRNTVDENGVTVRTEQDDNYDGTPSNFLAGTVTEHVYGTDGRHTETRYDIDGDGSVDFTHSYAYDSNGIRTQVNIDDDGTPGADRRVDYAYNVDGLLQTAIYYLDSGGTNVERREDYEYDDQGRISRVLYNRVEEAFAGGALISYDLIEDWNYNRRGLLSRISRDFGGDEDGTVDQIERRRYDDSGRLERVLYNDGVQGGSNRVEHLSYNAQGQVSSIGRDVDADGTIDETEARTYDALGRIVRADFNLDGTAGIDRADTFAYQGLGRYATERSIIRNGSDGSPEELEKRIFDERGRITAIEYYDDGTISGSDDTDRELSYMYTGADARPSSARYEGDRDGNLVWSADYTYDSSGRIEMVALEIDYDHVAGVDRVETYIYNYVDNTMRVEYDGVKGVEFMEIWPHQEFTDKDQDGTADLVQTITYADAVYNFDPAAVSGAGSAPSSFTLTQVVSIETNRITSTNDMTADRVDRYIYGGLGELTRVDAEENADGTVTRRFYHTDDDGIVDIYAYDRDPIDDLTVEVDVKNVRGSEDLNGDGTNDWIGDGTVDFMVGDGTIDRYASDGTFDAYRDLELDEEGRLVSRAHDFNFDGTNFQTDIEARYVYDSGVEGWGFTLGKRSVLSDMDLDGDGTMNDYRLSEHYQYLHFFAEQSDATVTHPRLTLTNDMVEDFHHLEFIDIGGDLYRPGDSSPTVALFNLTISVDVLEELSKSDGTVDSRYDAANPYTLTIWGDPSDNVVLSGGFTRDSSKDVVTVDHPDQSLTQMQIDNLQTSLPTTYPGSGVTFTYVPPGPPPAPVFHAYVSDAGIVLVDPAMDVTLIA